MEPRSLSRDEESLAHRKSLGLAGSAGDGERGRGLTRGGRGADRESSRGRNGSQRNPRARRGASTGRGAGRACGRCQRRWAERPWSWRGTSRASVLLIGQSQRHTTTHHNTLGIAALLIPPNFNFAPSRLLLERGTARLCESLTYPSKRAPLTQ